MSSSRIAYAMRLDATSEGEVAALSNVYKFVLDCHAKKKAASESRPDDAEGSENDRTATKIISKLS